MMSSWDEYADARDEDESAIAYSVEAFKSLARIVSPETKAILDFGCGTGLLTEKLSFVGKRVVALDSSVQWDWWSQDNESDFGLSEERVELAFKNAGLTTLPLSQPFLMSSSKGIMPVLMGVARNE
jgi:trans-aconitate methyltransferase